MRLRVTLVALLPLACHSSTSPSRALHVDLTVNGAKLGSFSCRGGLVFTTRATDVSSGPVQIQSLSLRFTPKEGGCAAQVAPIDPNGRWTIREGGTVEVRRVDLAGLLCESPGATPGCSWLATAEVATDTGPASDQIAFATNRTAEHCEGVVPLINSPVNGAVVSGTIEIDATVVEGVGCVNSARTIIEGFSEQGARVFSARIDVGELFRWDTTSVSNGRYWITAAQNCCGIPSTPVVVTVRN
jgi:hypothetical protein